LRPSLGTRKEGHRTLKDLKGEWKRKNSSIFMSKNIRAKSLALDKRVQDTAIAVHTAQYESACRQSVRDLLRLHGGTDASSSEASVGGPNTRPSTVVGEIRSLVRRVMVACRWAYDRVAL
jgi:hypothetical protein